MIERISEIDPFPRPELEIVDLDIPDPIKDRTPLGDGSKQWIFIDRPPEDLVGYEYGESDLVVPVESMTTETVKPKLPPVADIVEFVPHQPVEVTPGAGADEIAKYQEETVEFISHQPVSVLPGGSIPEGAQSLYTVPAPANSLITGKQAGQENEMPAWAKVAMIGALLYIATR